MLHFKDEKEFIKAITGQVKGKTLRNIYEESTYSYDGKEYLRALSENIGSYVSLAAALKKLSLHADDFEDYLFNFDSYSYNGHYRYVFSVGPEEKVHHAIEVLNATDDQLKDLVDIYPLFFRLAYPYVVSKKNYKLAEELLDIVDAKLTKNELSIAIDSLLSNEYIPFINRLARLGKLKDFHIEKYLNTVYDTSVAKENYRHADVNLKPLIDNDVDWNFYAELISKYGSMIKNRYNVTSLLSRKNELNNIDPFDLIEGDIAFQKEVFNIKDGDLAALLVKMSKADPQRLKNLLTSFLNREYSKASKKKILVKNYRRLIKILGDSFINFPKLNDFIKGQLLLDKLDS
jgi:hypothetical protein